MQSDKTKQNTDSNNQDNAVLDPIISQADNIFQRAYKELHHVQSERTDCIDDAQCNRTHSEVY